MKTAFGVLSGADGGTGGGVGYRADNLGTLIGLTDASPVQVVGPLGVWEEGAGAPWGHALGVRQLLEVPLGTWR